MQEHVLRSERDGVLELTINRPEKLNALSRAFFDYLREAVKDLRDRDDLRVLLIRSTGRFFSAGSDLTEGHPPALEGSATKARTWMRTSVNNGAHGIYEEMERVEKPIVVAHHATCVGAGLEMSLSCDFRLAAKSASYWFPEMQLGMLPLSNGISKLVRICGLHWARWMVVANEKVTADDARMMGLVHQVYGDDVFEDEVRAFCQRLAAFPPEVVAAGKLVTEMAQDLGTDQAKQLERLTWSSLTFAPGKADLAKKIHDKVGFKDGKAGQAEE